MKNTSKDTRPGTSPLYTQKADAERKKREVGRDLDGAYREFPRPAAKPLKRAA